MVETGSAIKAQYKLSGPAALMASRQSQGDHMLVHLVKLHAHTHTRIACATVNSQMTQGSAPLCLLSVCWSVQIHS